MTQLAAPQSEIAVGLSRGLLQHDHWDTAEDILRAAFKSRSRVAVKSCHASSKTFVAADATLIALLLGGDVITTAQTWASTRNVLWKQIRRNIADSKMPKREWGSVNLTGIELATGEFAIGLNTEDANEGVNFQGYHARPDSFLLIIVDEAPGVSPAILGAIEGIRAGGDVRLLYLGNPVISSGPFYDVFANDHPGWVRFTIDGFDTPNLRGYSLHDIVARDEDDPFLLENPRPYLIDKKYVWEKYREWGEDHPLWQSRVRGRFPAQSDDALLSLTWLEEAGLRKAEYVAGHPVSAGIDVAGPGEDETVLCVRQGRTILECLPFANSDARGPVLAALRPWSQRGLRAVNVDTAGLGHYFSAHLRDNLPPEVTVRDINVGESPTTDDNKERFANLKAELYWAFRERAREGDLAGLTDRTALAQLAGLRYAHDKRGRVVIESKEDARKRGVKSPDRAEAIVLAFAPPNSRDEQMSAFYALAGQRAKVVSR